MTGTHLYIVLPAFNEEPALAILLPEIARVLDSHFAYTIVLADDGSTDGTAALIQRLGLPVQLLRHPRNQGYGAALRTAFTWVIQNGSPDDIALSLDADNTHPPRYLPDFVSKMNEGFDIVTATYSRLGGKAFGVSLKRRWMSRIVNVLFRICRPLPGTRSYTNGFRAYRVRTLQRVAARYPEQLIEETGFPGGSELLLKSAIVGVRTTEIPFELHYEARGLDSKIRIGSTIARYLKLLVRFAWFLPGR